MCGHKCMVSEYAWYPSFPSLDWRLRLIGLSGIGEEIEEEKRGGGGLCFSLSSILQKN